MTRVAAFMGPARRVGPPPHEWLDAVRAPTGDRFDFALWRQEETKWCWAAIVQAVENARRGNLPSQQDVATAHIARHNPGATCAPPDRWTDNDGTCDEHGCDATCASNHAASVVLAERGLMAGTLSSGQPVSLAQVQTQTQARRPVICRMEGGRVGHFICIAGWWIAPNGVPWLLVHDPRNGVLGQPVASGYVRYDDVATRYPMGAAYGRNDHSYSVN